MKVLIACDKFKGSLSAGEVAQAIAKGLGPCFEIEQCPIADGGEGFVEAMLTAMNGERQECATVDALGRPITASYGLSGQTAIIEMADAAGLWRIAEEERAIRRSSTAGVGTLLLDAISQGATRVLMGLGGSATNDGGIGLARQLGWRFFDKDEREVAEPTPENLTGLTRIDGRGGRALPRIEVACDVDNPLLGEQGAAAIYGPQKGADGEDLVFLERFLAQLAAAAGEPDYAKVPGSGAAGGLGWGLMKFANARLRPGFDIVADAVGLRGRIAAADLVITGEGSLDAQSLSGKGPVGVARLAKEAGKTTVAVAGRITPEVLSSGLFDHSISLIDGGQSIPELIANAAHYTELESRALGERLLR